MIAIDKIKYPPLNEPNERTQKAIVLFHQIARKAREENWEYSFLSGFAIDAHFGYLTRDHRDVDVMVSIETAKKLQVFLESLGHFVYEPEKIKGEALKVDQADEEHPMRCSCDIHYFWEDESGNVVIPLLGKEMHFSAGIKDATEELNFLEEKAIFLKPEFILEEKNGWRDQIGLPVREPEHSLEREKIQYLIDLWR